MNTLLFLIAFPLFVALALLVIRQNGVRRVVVIISVGALTVFSLLLLANNFTSGAVYFDYEAEWVNTLMMVVEALLAVYITVISLRQKQYPAVILVLVQVGLTLYFELTYGHSIAAQHGQHNLFVDQFSIIMALIIGVIGGLICVYALGYMEDYHHHHHEIKERKPFFFFVLFLFLGAMYGLVFANNLLWLYFFWEITTICSFLLIGYTQTQTAVRNAFKALVMNLLGGLGFAIGIVYLYLSAHVIQLDQLLALNKALIALPVALFSFAGITKAAQFPFSSWLLGAMVAPTPTSALLHSSTMVKAGVYLIIRLAPALTGTKVGLLVALVGAVTFLLTSCIAITQYDAKRILAYSTVANLGLIIVCGAAGTPETVWAAIFLIIFHAVAKSAMFLGVGAVEHRLGERTIETMEGLLVKAPLLAVVLVIGICGMFLAPFGMLLSKWAALEGLVSVNPLLTVFVAYGSAATLFFWTKWIGKIIMVKGKVEPQPSTDATVKWSLIILAVLTVAATLGFPLVSSYSISPYLKEVFGHVVNLDRGNVVIMLIMMALMLILPLKLLYYKDLRYVDTYLGGANVDEEGKFMGALGKPVAYATKNYHLESWFGESKLFTLGVLSCSLLIIVMFGVQVL